MALSWMQSLMLSMALERVRSEASTLWVAKKFFTSSRWSDAAEGAGGGDDANAGVGGELSVDLVPVLLDVGPGLVAGFAGSEEDGEDDPAVLVANLAGDGVVEGAGDEGWVGEVGEGAEGVGCWPGSLESLLAARTLS